MTTAALDSQARPSTEESVLRDMTGLPRETTPAQSGPPPSALPMTDAEYELFVHRWVGIPYRLNGGDPGTGLDCRTLAVKFLRAQGVVVRDTDGEPLPDNVDDAVIRRYEAGVRAAGASVELRDLQRNDIVYYHNQHGRLHVGVWLGYDRILTIQQATGSFIFRVKRDQLRGAVRGRCSALLNLVAAPPGHDPITAAIIGGILAAGAVGGAGVAATIAGFSVGFAVIGGISWGIGALTAGRKSFDFDGSAGAGLDASNRYAFESARNVRSNQSPVPLIYSGLGIRVLQTYEIWNSGHGASEQKRLVAVGEGELGSITEVKLNGEDIAGFAGSSYTAYTGTASQAIDSRAAGTNVVGLKNTAYLALTLAASEKLNSDPVITCKVTGRKIKTWNGSTWTGATASGNPAAVLRDYLTLSRERGGCGFPESVLDDASFGAVYDYLEATVTNLDGTTEPRGRVDFIIDTFRPWLDNVQDIMATCGMFFASDGRKFYLRVEKTESAVQAFTDDQVRDLEYQAFSKDERPNRLIGVYIDPTAEGNDARTRVSVDDLVDQAKNPRGLVPREVNLLGLSRQTQAIREVTKLLNDIRANWYVVTFTARLEAIAIEPGDVFTLQHPILGDGTTAYSFRAIRIEELQDHSRRIVGKAYTASIYDDHMEQQTVTLGYTPPPNPFTPVADVTNLLVQAVGFIQQGDGAYMSTLRVTWTEPADKLYLDHYSIEWSENGGAYEERLVTFPVAGLAVLQPAKVDATYTVRVRTVNRFGIKSTGTTSSPITVDGKTALPSSVTGFTVKQVGDIVKLAWDPSADVDIWGYKIREGGTSWDTATPVVTVLLADRWDITEFTSGTKTYRIKAVDASGNESTVDATDSIVATAPSGTQTLFTYDLFHNGLSGGTFSAGAQSVYSDDFGLTYRRPAISLKTILRLETYAGTWANLETDLNWSTEQRETTQETYTSEVIDIGSVQEGITSIAHKAYAPNGTVSLDWAFSETDTNPSTFQAFTEGVYKWRYAKIKVKLQTNDTTKNVRVYELNLSMATRRQEDGAANVSVASGGTTINFTKLFSQTPRITITTVTNAYVPYITAQSKTSFTVKLRDPSDGLDKAGTINWDARGF